MRPDSLMWQDTRGLSALEFSPQKVIYQKVLSWIARSSMLQTVLALALWYGICVASSFGLLDSFSLGASSLAPETQGTTPSTAVLSKALASPHFLLLLGTQLASLVAVRLILMTRTRRILRVHADGLTALFCAIRDMASGVVPKPLTAGKTGEVGYLALAFNDMVARLIASRQALVEANKTLEARVEDRTKDLQKAAKRLEEMASTDALTGLMNRRALMEHGAELFEEAVRRDRDVVCLVIDLDNFKLVNDRFGHKRGDEVIKLAGQVLTNVCRSQDLVTRLGGDEFTVVMSLNCVGDAVDIAERMRMQFRQHVLDAFKDSDVPESTLPSMSIGITSRIQCRASAFDEMMIRADDALYRAKRAGKGRTEVGVVTPEKVAA